MKQALISLLFFLLQLGISAQGWKQVQIFKNEISSFHNKPCPAIHELQTAVPYSFIDYSAFGTARDTLHYGVQFYEWNGSSWSF